MKKAIRPVLVPTKERRLTPREYLKEVQSHADIIVDADFVPPKIGSKGFGFFNVRYSTPVLLPEGA